MSRLSIFCIPLKLFLHNYPWVEVVVNKDGYRIQRRDLSKEKLSKERIDKIKSQLGKQEATK